LVLFPQRTSLFLEKPLDSLTGIVREEAEDLTNLDDYRDDAKLVQCPAKRLLLDNDLKYFEDRCFGQVRDESVELGIHMTAGGSASASVCQRVMVIVL
jgi:hypothetical protein